MEDIVIIALAPFYTLGVAATAYGVYCLANSVQKMSQSATETQATETTSPSSTQQK